VPSIIARSDAPDSKISLANELPMHQSFSSAPIDRGMQMDFNAPQLENALVSIRVSFEFDSNVNDEREEHPIKHLVERISTDDGIQMDFNARQLENAPNSIRVSFESDSNVNAEREQQREKQ
jgi:hypothetical protein